MCQGASCGGKLNIRDNTKIEPVKPTLAMLMLVEKTILDAGDYMTKEDLFIALPRKMDQQVFLEVMEYLANSGKIIFDGDGMILWVGVESPAFRAMLDRCVKLMP